uniref:Uncharacterized protein n=1 Tax=Tanacetum cinerariifolium TaxID=118510 RepID=A0A6L2P4E4_TANCI|nr:hypothetical protein [Tanacetum cinerariifolium]
MDSIIPLGQKITLVEYMILFGVDNRPPMFDKDLPLIWPTIEENRVTRTKKYAKLSIVEKIQADCDMKATNMILQEVPQIQKTMPLLKMAGSEYNKFRGDKDKVILVLVIRVMLLVLGETMQVDRQGLLNTTTVKVKDIWLGNALSLSDQGMQHDIGIPNGQAVQIIILNNAALWTEDLYTYDSDFDDVSNAKVVLMANISNYGSDVISEKAQQIKPTLYDDIFIPDKHVAMPVIDDEETLILEEEKDFRKLFVPQQELSAEQAFWYHMSNPFTKSSAASPVKMEAPKELPKVMMPTNCSMECLNEIGLLCKFRFKLEMLLESVNSALKHVEELLNDINNRSVSSEGSIRVEDHFSGLEAETKETKEKSQKDDDVLYSVAAESKHSIVPHLEYDLTDKDIHEDLFKIIKYLCEEISTRVATRNEGESDGSPGVDSVTFNNVKQGKPTCNGNDSVSLKRVDSSKVIMVNGGTLPKEDGSRVETDVKNTGIRDKAPAIGVVNDNVLPRSSTELSGRDTTPRPRNVHDDALVTYGHVRKFVAISIERE